MITADVRPHTAPAIDELARKAMVRAMLNRRPTVGLALGVVREGRLEFFEAHGLADVATRRPVTENTVFRIASITNRDRGDAACLGASRPW